MLHIPRYNEWNKGWQKANFHRRSFIIVVPNSIWSLSSTCSCWMISDFASFNLIPKNAKSIPYIANGLAKNSSNEQHWTTLMCPFCSTTPLVKEQDCKPFLFIFSFLQVVETWLMAKLQNVLLTISNICYIHMNCKIWVSFYPQLKGSEMDSIYFHSNREGIE